jgi:hypothetical protein
MAKTTALLQGFARFANEHVRGANRRPRETFTDLPPPYGGTGRGPTANLLAESWAIGQELLVAKPEDLTDLAGRMVDTELDHRTRGDIDAVPSGYTYLGQFLNHDLMHGVPRPQRSAESSGLARSPALNLDAMYGVDPNRQTGLYTKDRPGDFAIGTSTDGSAVDLPRDRFGVPLIPEQRNGNNLLTAQLTALLMRFHNKLRKRGSLGFAEARTEVVHHYQAIVIGDLLPTLLDKRALADVFAEFDRGPSALHGSEVPIRGFVLAAWRLHTMSRSRYRLNDGRYTSLDDVLAATEATPRAFPLGRRLIVDWRRFFPQSATRKTRDEWNAARRIDARIAKPLHSMEIGLDRMTRRRLGLKPGQAATLHLVDLLSGNGQLPSGQSVASALRSEGFDVPELASQDLRRDRQGRQLPKGLIDQTPLIHYLLREADIVNDGQALGPCASVIAARAILGALESDKASVIYRQDWAPSIPTTESGRLKMHDLVSFMHT